ncbi:MAG TPA: PEP-CTERM sorting domain-containing protein [Candidatus Brocadiia bacterium]|nr:PEP-CTERM sorting domain-containing protein [Planctomycetota bacterium]MDO8092411.1 PEP-CTERM sorting domain-containing protein [Candidatus Brocadiales bacterium]
MGSNKYFLGRPLLFITLLSAIIALSFPVLSTRLHAHTISPTIGLPDIGWDSSGDASPPGPVNGVTTFTPGAPGTGILSMSGNVVSFIPNTIPGPLMVGGSVSIFASLTGTTVFPGFVHADFGTTGGVNPNPTGFDVEILDSVGALALGGNFGGLTIDGIFGSGIAAGGATFTPLGGYLLPDFIPGPAGIVHLEFSTVPTWSATSFTAAWTSESKGDVGPVPEPITIALLGTGLFGFLGYRRLRPELSRRFWRKN